MNKRGLYREIKQEGGCLSGRRRVVERGVVPMTPGRE